MKRNNFQKTLVNVFKRRFPQATFIQATNNEVEDNMIRLNDRLSIQITEEAGPYNDETIRSSQLSFVLVTKLNDGKLHFSKLFDTAQALSKYIDSCMMFDVATRHECKRMIAVCIADGFDQSYFTNLNRKHKGDLHMKDKTGEELRETCSIKSVTIEHGIKLNLDREADEFVFISKNHRTNEFEVALSDDEKLITTTLRFTCEDHDFVFQGHSTNFPDFSKDAEEQHWENVATHNERFNY